MPMEYQNLDEVWQFIHSAHATFGFHVDTASGNPLGDEMCTSIAEGIRYRAVTTASGGTTGKWPVNSEKYMKWKERKYGTPETNFRTDSGPGSMLSVESLKGVPAISPHEVQMKYGLDRVPSGNIHCADDLRRTDRQKAMYAYDDPKGNRGFFDLSFEETNRPLLMIAAQAFKSHLERQSWK